MTLLEISRIFSNLGDAPYFVYFLCAECAKFWDSKRKLKNVDKTPRKHAKLKEWQCNF